MEFRKVCTILLPLVVLTVSLLTAAASYGVTLVSEEATPLRQTRNTVVIDPGHGGEDGGAVSCTGVCESGLNLAVAERLEDLILFLGGQTRMTRASDVSLADPEARTVSEKKVSDLKNRVALVSDTENPILVSIHQNMFAESDRKSTRLNSSH